VCSHNAFAGCTSVWLAAGNCAVQFSIWALLPTRLAFEGSLLVLLVQILVIQGGFPAGRVLLGLLLCSGLRKQHNDVDARVRKHVAW
jgi:hypothetical protein